MALLCDIVSSEVVQGRTAYTISVEREAGQQTLLRRHYTDFLALDQEETVRCLAPESKPTLPPKGRLGLRHRLNLGSFNEQRLQGLRRYLKQLLQTEAGTSDAVEKFLACAPLETAPAGSVAAPPALEKLLSEEGAPTCSTATPRSMSEEDAAEGKEARNYRLLPSTGTWLLRLQLRSPAAADAAEDAVDAAAASADGATMQEASVAEPQVEGARPVRSYRLLPSTGTWLLRLPHRQPATGGSGEAASCSAAGQEAAPADAAAEVQVDAVPTAAVVQVDAEEPADAAAPIDAAEPCEAADANGDAAAPADVQAAAPADAADAVPAAAATSKAAAKAGPQQAPEPAQAAALSKSARRRARNKVRASAQ